MTRIRRPGGLGRCNSSSGWKKRSEETKTPRAGCSKAEPKNFVPGRPEINQLEMVTTLSYIQTQFGEDRCTHFRPTHKQTGAITIHCVAHIAQCIKYFFNSKRAQWQDAVAHGRWQTVPYSGSLEREADWPTEVCTLESWTHQVDADLSRGRPQTSSTSTHSSRKYFGATPWRNFQAERQSWIWLTASELSKCTK